MKALKFLLRAALVLGPICIVGVLLMVFIAKLGTAVPKIKPEDLTMFRIHNILLVIVLFHLIWMTGTISVLTNYWLERKRLGLRYLVLLRSNYHRAFEFAVVDALYLTYYLVKFHSFLS